MGLNENAVLKSMITNMDVNDPTKLNSAAYVHKLTERIGMGEELAIGANLTAGLNALNSNLLKYKQSEYTLTIASGDTNSNSIGGSSQSDFPTNHFATMPLIAYYGSSGLNTAVLTIGSDGTSAVVSGKTPGTYTLRVGYFYK
jgi:hypothetical protein